jgi:tetratricopeptide (TPR) repeat protein
MKNAISVMFEKNFFRTYFIIVLLFILLISISGCGKEAIDSNVMLKKAIAVAAKEGKWDESLEYAEKAVEADPQNADALVMYALALENSNQKDKAKKELRKTIKGFPNNFMAQLSLGRLLYTEKDYEGAYENLANAYRIKPENIDALVLFAQCSAKLQTQDTGELYLKLAQTKYFKNKPVIYNELGIYYMATKNLSKATQNLSKAYKLSPNNPIIVANLGVFCDRDLKQLKQACFFYRKFITLTNDNPAFNLQRTEIIARLKEISKK